MAKTIKKKSFSLDSVKDRFSSKTKYKKDRFIDLGETFQKATGVPGPAIGHLNVFLGHSDTGKTTAVSVRSSPKHCTPKERHPQSPTSGDAFRFGGELF